MSQWKRQLLDGASELFIRGKQTKDKDEGQAKEAELFQQIGRLQMELEWLKKSFSCSDARELRMLVDHDHPDLSVSRQCVLLGLPPDGGLPGARCQLHRRARGLMRIVTHLVDARPALASCCGAGCFLGPGLPPSAGRPPVRHG